VESLQSASCPPQSPPDPAKREEGSNLAAKQSQPVSHTPAVSGLAKREEGTNLTAKQADPVSQTAAVSGLTKLEEGTNLTAKQADPVSQTAAASGLTKREEGTNSTAKQADPVSQTQVVSADQPGNSEGLPKPRSRRSVTQDGASKPLAPLLPLQKLPRRTLSPTEMIATKFPLNENMHGIIRYLTKKYGGNVHAKGIVTVTSKSIRGFALNPTVVADLDSDSPFQGGTMAPADWVCWDFREMCVCLTHYTIRAVKLKSWVVEGSLDGLTWTEVDLQANGPGFEQVGSFSFCVSKPMASYCAIRLRQTTGGSPYQLYAVEFFGTISEPRPVDNEVHCGDTFVVPLAHTRNPAVDAFNIVERGPQTTCGYQRYLGHEKGPGPGREVNACKTVRDLNVSDVDAVRFARTVCVESQLSLPGVAKVYDFGVFGDKGKRGLMIEEFAPLGIFADAIAARLKNGLPRDVTSTTFSKVIFGVAATMAHVHAFHIVHGDIKPDNVLLNKKGEPLLTGYLWKFCSESDPMESLVGTGPYMAPELSTSPQSDKSDVFAFGHFLYTIFAGLPPKAETGRSQRDQWALMNSLKGAKYDKPKAISDSFWNLIGECRNEKADQRPSFRDITRRMMDCDDFTIDGTDMTEYHEYRRRIMQESSNAALNDPSPVLTKLWSLGFDISSISGLHASCLERM
jgi:serine/threonine protein kinase